MKYVGYHNRSLLPVKAGDSVLIRKGVVVRYRGQSKPSGRTYRVNVDHVLSGMTDGDKQINPSVRWAGAGGYWAEADINDVLTFK